MSVTVALPKGMGLTLHDPDTDNLEFFKSTKARYAALKQGLCEWKTYLIYLEKTWNAYARESGLEIEIDTKRARSKLQELHDNPDEITTYERVSIQSLYFQKSNDGKLHDTQIRTIIDAMISLRDSQYSHTVLLGIMQLGKTLSMLGLSIITPIYAWLSKEIRIGTIVCAPNLKNILNSHQEENEKFQRLHQHIKFHSGDKSIMLGNWLEQTEYSRKNFLLDDSLVVNINDIHGNSVKDIDKFREQVAGLLDQNDYVLLYFDESHYGTAKDGVIDRNVKPFFDEITHDQPTVSWIATSATPYEQRANEKFNEVLHWIGEGYHGPRFMEGREMPCIGNKESIHAPRLVSFARWIGIHDEQDINPQNYKSFESFLKKIEGLSQEEASELSWSRQEFLNFIENGINSNEAKKKVDPEIGHFLKQWDIWKERYVTYLTDAVINTIGIPNMDDPIIAHNYDGRRERGLTDPRGIMMRPAGRNSDLEDIKTRMERQLEADGLLDEIVVIIHNHKSSAPTVKDAIKHYANSDKKYVILFSGGARMSVKFPDHCAFFLDFTKAFSTATALLQGVVGRACGHGKWSTVFLTERNYEDAICTLKNNGRTPASHKHLRVTTANGYHVPRSRGRKTVSVALFCKRTLELYDPTNPFFHELTELLLPYYDSNRQSKSGSKMKRVTEETRAKANAEVARLFRKHDIYNLLRTHSTELCVSESGYPLVNVDPVEMLVDMSKVDKYANMALNGKPNRYTENTKKHRVIKTIGWRWYKGEGRKTKGWGGRGKGRGRGILEGMTYRITGDKRTNGKTNLETQLIVRDSDGKTTIPFEVYGIGVPLRSLATKVGLPENQLLAKLNQETVENDLHLESTSSFYWDIEE